MRWLLAILVLVNGVAFYWFSGQARDGGGREANAVNNVGDLLLLSERPAVVSQSTPSSIGDQCVVIGPIEDSAVVSALSEALAQGGVALESWLEASEVASYRIYLAPMTDLEEASQQRLKLAEDGLEGSIIRQGQMVGGISLGLFNNRVDAETRKEQLLELGYPVSLLEEATPVNHHWVQFDAARRSELSDQLWLQVQSGSPGAEISEKNCAVVASLPDIP